MSGYNTFTITSIANPGMQYQLDDVEFMNNGLQAFLDACRNRITKSNQRFSIFAVYYGDGVLKDGRYSANIDLLLKKQGKWYLNKAIIRNADFNFRVLERDKTESKLRIEITVYPLPGDDSACEIKMVE